MKLVIYGSEMEKREQELLEHNGKYNNNKLEPQFDIYQDSVLEDEYDGEFWLKVSWLKCLIITFASLDRGFLSRSFANVEVL